jgi:hypothetical protein
MASDLKNNEKSLLADRKLLSYGHFPSLIRENQNAICDKPEILELLY